MKRLAIPAVVVLGILSSVTASGQDAWGPYQSESSLSLVYSFQTFEDFFRNHEEKSYPFGRSRQQTVFAIVEYGLTDALAIDVTFAYSHTSTSKTPGGPTRRERQRPGRYSDRLSVACCRRVRWNQRASLLGR